jgi:hypothetical protein
MHMLFKVTFAIVIIAKTRGGLPFSKFICGVMQVTYILLNTFVLMDDLPVTILISTGFTM